MKLLLRQRLPHLILRNNRAQGPQRRRQIHPPFRLNRHLSSQRRTKLQIDLAQGCSGPQAVGLGGEAYRAGEGEAVVEGAGSGGAGGSSGGGSGSGVGVVEVELVEDLVEVGGFLGWCGGRGGLLCLAGGGLCVVGIVLVGWGGRFRGREAHANSCCWELVLVEGRCCWPRPEEAAG